jgi:hypothetical protein
MTGADPALFVEVGDDALFVEVAAGRLGVGKKYKNPR